MTVLDTFRWTLRLRAWIVFTSLFGCPVILESLLVIDTFSTNTIRLIAVVTGVMFFGYFFWIVSILVTLRRIHDVGSSVANKASIGGILIVVVTAFLSYEVSTEELPSYVLMSILRWIATIAFFGILLYTAYLIKSAESKRKIALSECFSELFFVWIFPIGIWILQPRLNKLAGDPVSIVGREFPPDR
jgi:hypothetical protein